MTHENGQFPPPAPVASEEPVTSAAAAAAVAANEAEPTAAERAAEQPRAPEAPDLERLRQERDEFKDLLLRKSAEFDNYRKRVASERREQAELAAADLVRDLLPILDDLERAAVADARENPEAYRRGIELIGKRLADVLARRGVTPIDPLGTRFDPREHEAVSYEPREGAADHEVIEVLARGYRMGERLLRPALVKVASA